MLFLSHELKNALNRAVGLWAAAASSCEEGEGGGRGGGGEGEEREGEERREKREGEEGKECSMYTCTCTSQTGFSLPRTSQEVRMGLHPNAEGSR